MVQIKEFLNYQEGQDTKVNEWIKSMGETIDIRDIKYSVGSFPRDDAKGWDMKEFSGVLIIYRINDK